MRTSHTAIKLVFLLLSTLLPAVLFGQSAVVLDQLTTLESYQKVYHANSFDHSNPYFRKNDKGRWNGFSVKEVYFNEDYFSCSLDVSKENAVNQFIAYLEQTYPTDLSVEQEYYERKYTVATRAFDLVFTVEVREDADIQENTEAELIMKFSRVVNHPLANLSEELKTNENGITCFLQVSCYNVVPTILVDGIPILPKNKEDEYSTYGSIALNKYILNSDTPIDLAFLLTPGIDDEGKVMPKIPKNSYASFSIEYINGKGEVVQTIDLFNNRTYVTDTIVENGDTRYYSYPGSNDYTKKDIRFNHQLKAPVAYNVTGWTKGKDLRKEKNLEEQIKQFYRAYATLILDKNLNAMTQLLYDSFLEKYTYNYNNTELKSYHEYDNLEYMLERTFKVVTAEQTKLHISANGKLAYLEAVDKTAYLKAVGLDYIKNISFLFYIDNNTNELKIIR